MTDLTTAVLATARRLMDVFERQATGGSATTLIDTSFPSRSGIVPEDDWFNGGTIHHLSGSRTGWSVITDWVKSTTTFTVATGTAVAATNRYAAYKGTYSLDILISAINQALQRMPAVPDEDTSLTTTALQESYTLPAGVYDVREVLIEQFDTDPKYKVDVRPWMDELDGTLKFKPGREWQWTGDTIHLWYYTKHTDLTAATDTISNYLALEWLSMEAAIIALEWRVMVTGGQDASVLWQLEKYMKELPMIRAKHINKIPRLAPITRYANL